MVDSEEDGSESADAEEGDRRTQKAGISLLDKAHLKAHDELRRVDQVISEFTELPSNWNGNVELHYEPGWRGMKPFRCDIRLDIDRQKLDARWRTHLHEVLHAHSAGYLRAAFDDYPGWEEGVVEKLQRLLRPRVVAHLGLELSETVFAQEDAEHDYNPYVEALDKLYRFLQLPHESETDFYVGLLSTPISQRIAWTITRGRKLPPEEGSAFFRAFATANATLRRKLRT